MIRTAWAPMWSYKIDYIETQISENIKKYPIVLESINYFIGLTENAIELSQNVKSDIYICHKRFKYDYTEIDFYNPLNIVFDSRVRDVAEYFKDCFFNDIPIDNMVLTYIKQNNLTLEEKKLFLSRLLYPSYYFDEYDKLINNENHKLNKIIEKIDMYERLLKLVYINLNIDVDIEWLM